MSRGESPVLLVSGGNTVGEVMRQEHRRRHVNSWKHMVDAAARRSLRRFHELILVTSVVGLNLNINFLGG